MSRLITFGPVTVDIVADDNTYVFDESMIVGREEETIRKLFLYLTWSGITNGSGDADCTLSGVAPFNNQNGVIYTQNYGSSSAPVTSFVLFSGASPGNSGAIRSVGTYNVAASENLSVVASSIKFKTLLSGTTPYTAGTIIMSAIGVTW